MINSVFTHVSFIYSLSRTLTCLVTSFGFVYAVKFFGNSGVLIIMVPICIVYKFGLNYFEKLEEKDKIFNNKKDLQMKKIDDPVALC